MIGGSTLFKVILAHVAHWSGQVLGVGSIGASQANVAILLSLGFLPRSPATPSGVMHLCRFDGPCGQTYGHRSVYHVDTFRMHDPANIEENWAANLPPLAAKEVPEEGSDAAADAFDQRVAELRRPLVESRRDPQRVGSSPFGLLGSDVKESPPGLLAGPPGPVVAPVASGRPPELGPDSGSSSESQTVDLELHHEPEDLLERICL